MLILTQFYTRLKGQWGRTCLSREFIRTHESHRESYNFGPETQGWGFDACQIKDYVEDAAEMHFTWGREQHSDCSS